MRDFKTPQGMQGIFVCEQVVLAAVTSAVVSQEQAIVSFLEGHHL